MKCCFCQDQNGSLSLLPIEDLAGENWAEWACMICIKQNGLYCQKHDLTHVKFISPNQEDVHNEHACLLCVDDLIRENSQRADDYRDRIAGAISHDESRRLMKWADVAISITGDPDSAFPILRAVAAHAVRTDKTVEGVIKEIEETHTIKNVLPAHCFV